jgi:addiction module HigA family antidote
MAKSRRLPPIHPGEILREDFMVPLGITMNQLALDLHVPVTRVAEIVHERRGITPDAALRLDESRPRPAGALRCQPKGVENHT